jgi:hypothetical protein
MSKYNSKIIFEGQKKNKAYFSKQIVIQKELEKQISSKEISDISKKFKDKMKNENPDNKISIVGYTPLGWRTFLSFDNAMIMDDNAIDDYFNGRIEGKDYEKFTEVSQLMLIVNRPQIITTKVSKNKNVKMKK